MTHKTQIEHLLEALVSLNEALQKQGENRVKAAEPSVIQVTIPDIVVNVPPIQAVVQVKAIPVIIREGEQQPPVVKVNIPPQQKIAKSVERQQVARDVSGKMTGTQSVKEFIYQE